MKNWRIIARWFSVTVGVIALTSISIDAAFSPNGVSQTALGIVASSVVPKKECPNGMTSITFESKTLCVDMYEVSPGPSCEHKVINGTLDTRSNTEGATCIPISEKSTVPWTYVTYHQAKELCAKAGKRLLSNKEWYESVLGTPDSSQNPVCNVSGTSVEKTGTRELCATTKGVYDGIGNVWEWVDATVEDGVYEGVSLPESGYVVNADDKGIARETKPDTTDTNFHDDYFWSDPNGEFGMIRGGFFGSGSDAGTYSVQAKTQLSFSGNAIGFRCAMDL
jgi:hypothetical protein